MIGTSEVGVPEELIADELAASLVAMLEELESAEYAKSNAAMASSDDLSLNALNNGGGQGGRKGARGAWRGGRRSGPVRGPVSASRFSVKTKSDKFCRMCFLAGTDPKVHTSSLTVAAASEF